MFPSIQSAADELERACHCRDATLHGLDPRPRRRRSAVRRRSARARRSARGGRAGDRDRGALERRQVDAAEPAGGPQGSGAHLEDARADAGPGDVLAPFRAAGRGGRRGHARGRAAPDRPARVRLREGVAGRSPRLAAADRRLHAHAPRAGAVRGADRRAPRDRGRGAAAVRMAGDRKRARPDRVHEGRQAVRQRARPAARARAGVVPGRPPCRRGR